MVRAKTRFGNPSGCRSKSGTAAIEFGLFIPFLLILFTGTVELGFAMYEAMQVNNAAEAGMLYAAKNGWDSAGITKMTCTSSCPDGSAVSQYVQVNAARSPEHSARRSQPADTGHIDRNSDNQGELGDGADPEIANSASSERRRRH